MLLYPLTKGPMLNPFTICGCRELYVVLGNDRIPKLEEVVKAACYSQESGYFSE